MSLKENDTWLESAYENFHEALDQKDWKTAKALVADTLEVDSTVGRNMNKELRDEMDKAPTFAEKYVLSFLKRKNEEYRKAGYVPTLDLLIGELEGKKE